MRWSEYRFVWKMHPCWEVAHSKWVRACFEREPTAREKTRRTLNQRQRGHWQRRKIKHKFPNSIKMLFTEKWTPIKMYSVAFNATILPAFRLTFPIIYAVLLTLQSFSRFNSFHCNDWFLKFSFVNTPNDFSYQSHLNIGYRDMDAIFNLDRT